MMIVVARIYEMVVIMILTVFWVIYKEVDGLQQENDKYGATIVSNEKIMVTRTNGSFPSLLEKERHACVYI